MCKPGCTDCDDCRRRVEHAIRKARVGRKLKPTHGVKKEHGEYAVVANSGRPMGDYRTRAAADRRVRQIMYFKHHPGA